MFKNRELKLQFVKTPTADPDTTPRTRAPLNPFLINALVNRNVENLAVLIGVGYAGKKVLDTAAEISLIAARAKFK